MKKLFVLMTLISTIVISTIVISTSNSETSQLPHAPTIVDDSSAIVDDSPIITQYSTSYTSKNYTSIDQLINSSTTIIKGTVLNSTGVTDTDGTIYTNLEVQSDEILKGNIATDDILNLRTRGGEMNYIDFVSSLNNDTIAKLNLPDTKVLSNNTKKVVNYVDGIKQYEKNDTVLIFLESIPEIESNPEKDTDATISNSFSNNIQYRFVGDAQGQFYYDNNKNEIFRYKASSNPSILNSTYFNSLESKELIMDFNTLKQYLN